MSYRPICPRCGKLVTHAERTTAYFIVDVCSGLFFGEPGEVRRRANPDRAATVRHEDGSTCEIDDFDALLGESKVAP